MATLEDNPCWLNEKLPPPVATAYCPKGTWDHAGDLNTYVVGSQTSKNGLVVVYDVFGASLQVLQGADRLAEHLNALVVMPDLFRGNAPDHDEFMKDPVKGRQGLQEFMKIHANFDINKKVLLELMSVFGERFQAVDSWGVFGLCWGGKLAVLATIVENSPFKASGQTHPGGLSAEDAKALTTPHICMPSKDEPADVVAEYDKILTAKNMGKVERFPTMFHGWMGARANLSDQENLVEYQRGYAVAAEFFAKSL